MTQPIKPTRKEVERFIIANGGKPHYSGKRNTLFIASYSEKCESKVIDQFGYGLPFKLKTINMAKKIYVNITD